MDYNYLLYVFIISSLLIIFLSDYFRLNTNIEKYRPYYHGTRLCNNRGCDVRYVVDKGTYYCRKDRYKDLIENNLTPPNPSNTVRFP